MLLWAGIVLPVFMVVFEFRTQKLAGACFDPTPTLWHARALFCISLANLSAWLFLQFPNRRLLLITVVLQGLALAPALLYSTAIGPHALYAGLLLMVGICGYATQSQFFGWSDFVDCGGVGLAVLAPAFGFAGLVIGFIRLWRKCKVSKNLESPFALQLGAVAVGSLLMIGMELPRYRTHGLIQIAVSPAKSKTDQEKAVELLRKSDHESLLLRLCNPPLQFSSGGALYACGPTDLFGPTTHLMNSWRCPGLDINNPIRQASTMRDLFQRITGNNYNEAPTLTP